ncbi:MAG TPA: cytochrome c [Candidatus Binatia bacterium]|nr:cytochrome c [Candidatus Binatia bacterium]
MYKNKFFSLALGVLFVLSVSSRVSAQEDVLKKRKALMEDSYDALKAIKSAVAEKDYSTVAVKARQIMGNMDHVVEVFPKGVTFEKSRAKPEIWEKWDQFSKIPTKVKDVAGALAKAADAKDEAAVQTQFKALGTESPFRSGACYECHKDFRSSPPAKTKSAG